MKTLVLLTVLIFSFSSLAEVSLIGKWQSSCTKLIKRHSVISYMEITPEILIVIQRLYADQECKILNLELKSEAIYQNIDLKFDWQPIQITLNIVNPEVVNFYNTNEMCGYNNWTLNQVRDVAGKLCKPNYMPSLGVIYQDHFLVKGSSVLQFNHFPDILQNTSAEHRTLETPLIFNRID